MEHRQLHEWPAGRSDACRIQERLSADVTLFGSLQNVNLITAIDTAYGAHGNTLYACAVTVSFPDIEQVETAFHYGSTEFPYIPGLLFFREGPIISKALSKLKSDPDLIIVHGHGIAHPRQCGMACHLGLAFDRPTVGCARRLLAGAHKSLPTNKGACQPMILNSKEVGVAYRSKDRVKPIFISPGHKCDLDQAKDIIVRNLRGFRLPEPLRLAHLLANKGKRRIEKRASAHQSPIEETA